MKQSKLLYLEVQDDFGKFVKKKKKSHHIRFHETRFENFSWIRLEIWTDASSVRQVSGKPGL